MKINRSYFYCAIGTIGCLLVFAAEAPAPLMSPGDIDLYRQLGLRLAGKNISGQNSLELLCIVEEPELLKKRGMAYVSKGDRVRLSQEAKNRWRVENETQGEVLYVDAAIGKFYDQ